MRIIPAILALMAMFTAGAAQANPAVVELFTSQGCSSCPPANANLASISARSDVIALSFNVTYWDYLGWKDTFAKPEFTERQRLYEPKLGHNGPFTPQIVINGSLDTVGDRLSEVERLIARAHMAGPMLTLNGDVVTIAGAPSAGRADIWLVRYDPRTIDVPVGRGENAGVTLPHKNVVRELMLVGSWTGAPQRFTISPARNGLRTAILLQRANGGPILSALSD